MTPEFRAGEQVTDRCECGQRLNIKQNPYGGGLYGFCYNTECEHYTFPGHTDAFDLHAHDNCGPECDAPRYVWTK